MKRIFSMLLVFVAIFTISAKVYAIDETEIHFDSSEMVISDFPVELYENHKQLISNTAGSTTVYKYSELEMINQLNTMSEADLIDMGYTSDQVELIKNDQFEQEYVNEIMRRSSLSTAKLKSMGYSDEKISTLRNLTGYETVEELSTLGLVGELTCYNELFDYYHSESENRTYFLVSFGWEWTQKPWVQSYDCIGLGWNNNYGLNNNVDEVFNWSFKSYVYNNNEIKTKSRLVEVQLNNAADTFSVKYEDNTLYYAKSGFGILALSEATLDDSPVLNSKCEFKYGHSTFGFSDSIGLSLPVGIGFTIEGAESIYMDPDGVLYEESPRYVE